MYAIVRCGGRQEKAAVDEVLTVDTLAGEAGSSVTLPAVLVVDDGKVISDPAELRRYQVTAEILGTIAGPKINMIHFRNKTGYRRRLGHRQRYTQVKITSITAGRSGAAGGRKAAATDKATGGAEKPAAASSGGEGPGPANKVAAAGRKTPAPRRQPETTAAEKTQGPAPGKTQPQAPGEAQAPAPGKKD